MESQRRDMPGFAPESRGGGSGGGGTFVDAPVTGDTYGRCNGTWRKVPRVYIHTQAAPAAVWNIQHNLGEIPVSVLTLSSGGEQIIGEEDWAASTLNLMVVRFSQPLTGVAYATY